MIKSLVILVLLLVVAVGAFLTRPSQDSFNAYVKNKASTGKLSLAGVVSGFETDNYLHNVIFHDRILWTSVEQNGQTQYVGVFGHFFATSSAPQQKS